MSCYKVTCFDGNDAISRHRTLANAKRAISNCVTRLRKQTSAGHYGGARSYSYQVIHCGRRVYGEGGWA